MRALLLWAILAGCQDTTDEIIDTGNPISVEGPVLTHEPPGEALVEGQSVTLTVDATDDQGVARVQVFWRRVGSAVWESNSLESSADGYVIEISDLSAPGLEYYFRATDGSPAAATSVLPAAGEDEAFTLDVLVLGAPLPWQEDFEAPASTLYDLGWLEASFGFPGYTWELTDTPALDGVAIQHRRGLEETGAMDDWLISPPLDLSSADSAQLSWWEFGSYTSGAAHSVWASTGSPEPEDGDFVEVIALPEPEQGTWARGPSVDLQQWVGEPLVYLAFRYEGTYADVWTLDDVAVGDATSDLRITEVAWTRFDPGATNTVTVTVENSSGLDAEDVVVSGLVDAASGSFSAPVSLGTLTAGSAASADLQLSVDASFPDDSWLPIELVAAAADFEERRDTEVLVGDATVADLDFTTFGEGLVVLSLGAGDPENPSVEIEGTTAIYPAGSWSLEVDLTAYASLLPPGPGPDRWWARVESSSTGSLTGFTIRSGDQSWVGDDFGAWSAATETLFYLPRPPEPGVFSSVTTPLSPVPGQNCLWDLTLVNYGLPTTGATSAVVSTADPDVTLISTDPFDLGDGWGENQSRVLALEFDLAASQDDSSDVLFDVVVTDTLESFLLEVSVPVPWPVVGLTSAVVEDFLGGNGDGLPDVGETFELALDLTNSGGLDTFGPLQCLLTLEGGAAGATVTDATGLFATIGGGATETDQGFELVLTSGQVGDDLQLLLTCTDDLATYVLPFELLVGEPPWRALTTVQDPAGDAQQYDFDFTAADWRIVGDLIEFRLRSAVPYDTSTLFLEAFMDSVGAPFFDYNLIYQSGVARLRGRDITGYRDLSTPEVQEIDAQTLVIRWSLSSMELVQNQIVLGFGTGYCGSETYYCDHYPDAWGAPYQGFIQSRWATVSW